MINTSAVAQFIARSVIPAMKASGFTIFSGPLNLNIVAWRTPSLESDSFDDWLFVFETAKADPRQPALLGGNGLSVQVAFAFRVTTDPGAIALAETANPKGVARLAAPQQISHGMKIGKHKGEYAALKQNAEFTVWRDLNKNRQHDMKLVDKGWFGINIHASNLEPFVKPTSWEPGRKVGRWSEGCIVFADGFDYVTHFWPWIVMSADKYSDVFTLTVLEGATPPWAS